MMTLHGVVIRPGRNSYGEQRRTQSWERLFAAADGSFTDMAVLDGPTRLRYHHASGALRGFVVPEALLWNGQAARAELEALNPDVVVLQTARACRPEVLAGPWTTIVDVVDPLSVSYRQRANIDGGPKALALRVLAASHERFEGAARQYGDHLVAAGRTDAERLDAVWLPNVIDKPPTLTLDRSPTFDVVFFGSLGYPPNVEALRWFAQADTSSMRVLIAGSSPGSDIKALCEQNHWTLAENYPDNSWLAAQARLAMAPLQSTAGIQNKVLEAAAIGLPQVATPAALAGVDDTFPAVIADTPDDFVSALHRLLSTPREATELARDAQDFVRQRYSTDAWLSVFERLVHTPGQAVLADR